MIRTVTGYERLLRTIHYIDACRIELSINIVHFVPVLCYVTSTKLEPTRIYRAVYVKLLNIC